MRERTTKWARTGMAILLSASMVGGGLPSIALADAPSEGIGGTAVVDPSASTNATEAPDTMLRLTCSIDAETFSFVTNINTTVSIDWQAKTTKTNFDINTNYTARELLMRLAESQTGDISQYIVSARFGQVSIPQQIGITYTENIDGDQDGTNTISFSKEFFNSGVVRLPMTVTFGATGATTTVEKTVTVEIESAKEIYNFDKAEVTFASATYNGAAQGPSVKSVIIKGIEGKEPITLNGSDYQLATSSTEYKDAQKYENVSIILTDAGKESYFDPGNDGVTGTYTIDPKTIYISGVDGGSKVYDGTTEAWAGHGFTVTGASISGIVAADSSQASNILSSLKGEYDSPNVKDATKIVLSTDAEVGKNYVLKTDKGQGDVPATITKRPIAIMVADDNLYAEGYAEPTGEEAVNNLINALRTQYDSNKLNELKSKYESMTTNQIDLYAKKIYVGDKFTKDNVHLVTKTDTMPSEYLDLAAGQVFDSVVLKDVTDSNGSNTATKAGYRQIEPSRQSGDVKIVASDKTDVTENYDIKATRGSYVLVHRGTPEATVTPKQGLVYNKSAQALVTGTTTGGTLLYADSEKGEFSETVPTGTDAGEYEVYYKVQGNDDYVDVDVAGPITVTIAPAPTEAKVEGKTLTYNGAEQPLAEGKLTKGEGTLVYSLSKDGTYTKKVPTATNAGSYTIWYKVEAANNNYVGTEPASVTTTIVKAPLTVTAKDKSINKGDEPANDGVDYKGFVGRDTKGVLSGTLAYDYAGYVAGSEPGTYAITPSGLTSNNYEITFQPGTLNVINTELPVLSVSYAAHSQTYGWNAPAGTDGTTAGTTGQSKRLEAISAKVDGGSISYRVHAQSYGWLDWAHDGEEAGTTGQSKRIEAIQMTLSDELASQGYHVWYRVHSQSQGWLGWAHDGEAAGTAGLALRAEAYEVQVLREGELPHDYVAGQASYIGSVKGNAHVQTRGWLGDKTALSFGTTGQSKRLEAIALNLPAEQPVNGGGISYRVHVQGIGWMDAAANGAIAGTTGQAKRIEAVSISLTGDEYASKYSVWYRVHSQRQGWLGWAHDGEEAGTTGLSLRAEAIDIQVLPAGQVPSGYNASQSALLAN